MDKVKYYSRVLVVLNIFWLILNESFHITYIIFGFLISLIAIIFTDNYLMVGNYKNFYRLNLILILKFLVFLIIEIYQAGIMTIFKILKNKTNIGIVEIETKLKNDLLISILANAITLTPGTVTLDKKGNKLKVLCLNCPKNNKDNKRSIVKDKLENILSGGKL